MAEQKPEVNVVKSASLLDNKWIMKSKKKCEKEFPIVEQMLPIVGSALDYLNCVDQLVVFQDMDFFVAKNQKLYSSFVIQNNLGQIAFDAIEEYDTTRMGFFVGPGYVDMSIYISDFLQREAIFMYRTVRWNCCLIKEKTRVESPRGTVLGYIVSSYLCRPKYTIENALGAKMFTVRSYRSGPFGFAGKVYFEVLTENNDRTATISRLFFSVEDTEVRNPYAYRNYLKVVFPMNMDLNAKTLILSTAVHIYTNIEFIPPLGHYVARHPKLLSTTSSD